MTVSAYSHWCFSYTYSFNINPCAITGQHTDMKPRYENKALILYMTSAFHSQEDKDLIEIS